MRSQGRSPTLAFASAQSSTSFPGIERGMMKPAFLAILLGAAIEGRVVRADDPATVVKQEESVPARPHFGRGGGKGQLDDPRFNEDRKGFHFLLDNRARIRRTIEQLPDGVETVTESDDPEVAAGIQTHVAAMHVRLTKRRGIHLRDPLFREVFRHADEIHMKIEDIENGVRVTETSDDPYVASLVQAHAHVVSQFIEHGHDEVRKNHDVPPRPERPQPGRPKEERGGIPQE